LPTLAPGPLRAYPPAEIATDGGLKLRKGNTAVRREGIPSRGMRGSGEEAKLFHLINIPAVFINLELRKQKIINIMHFLDKLFILEKARKNILHILLMH